MGLSEYFITVAPTAGINIDLIFLAVDIFVIMLLLVGLETGFIQKHWTELGYKMKVLLRLIGKVRYHS